MQTPTIGRIVIAHGVDPLLNNGATEAPAIITRVWSGGEAKAMVNCKVITDQTDDIWWTSVDLVEDVSDSGNSRCLTWPLRA